MKTHINKVRDQQKAVVQKIRQEPMTRGIANIEDNRSATIYQRKVKESINASFASKTPPVQRKQNKTGLPGNLKNGIESLSGYSMDNVQVHYNSSKPAQLRAHAYAQGTDIHLAPGQEKHLPHEAWHVVQQKQGKVKPTMQLTGKVNINDDVALEREADLMGAKALHFRNGPKSESNEVFTNEKISSASKHGVIQKVGEDQQIHDLSLTNVLSDPYLALVFRAYCSTKSTVELLDFYMAFLATYGAFDGKRMKPSYKIPGFAYTVQSLYDVFIDPNGPFMINISAEVQIALANFFRNRNNNFSKKNDQLYQLFSGAFLEAYNLLRANTHANFIHDYKHDDGLKAIVDDVMGKKPKGFRGLKRIRRFFSRIPKELKPRAYARDQNGVINYVLTIQSLEETYEDYIDNLLQLNEA